jgi:hypothetical protein
MAFDLTIYISGLCLYATEGSSRVHVLMPKAHAHHHGDAGGHAHDVPQHFAKLHIPRKHIARPRGDEPEEVEESIDGFALDLGQVSDSLDEGGTRGAGATIDAKVPDDLLPLGDLLGCRVPASRLVGDGGGTVQARLSFSNGRATCCEPGALWEVQGVHDAAPYDARMAYIVGWTITGINRTELNLALAPLGLGTSKALPALRPRDVRGRPRIELFLRFLPAEENRPVKFGEPPAHMTAFYPLFAPCPRPKDPRVELKGDVIKGTCLDRVSTFAPDFDLKWFGDPYSCGGTRATIAGS